MLTVRITVDRLSEVLAAHNEIIVERTNTVAPGGVLTGWTEVGRLALAAGVEVYEFFDASPPTPLDSNYYRTAYATSGSAPETPYSAILQGFSGRPGRRVWGTSDTGYWGPNPRAIVRGWNVPDRIYTMNQQQLWAMGRPVYLYIPVHPQVEAHQPNLGVQDVPLTPCSCVKRSTESADRTCATCYGTGYAPGYVRCLTSTYAVSSSEYASSSASGGFTPAALPTGLALDTALKPNRLRLADDALEGVIERTWGFSNEDLTPWESHLSAYVPPSGSGVVEVSYSVDGGATFSSALPAPAPSGSITVRVRLGRTALADESPLFEVFRLRHVRGADQSPELLAYRSEERPVGSILVLRPWNQQKTSQDPGRALLVEHPSSMSWTMPLSAFDQRVQPDTPQAALPQDTGPVPPMMEIAYGVRRGQRFTAVDVAYSEEILRLTSQKFNERRVQPGEPLARVW